MRWFGQPSDIGPICTHDVNLWRTLRKLKIRENNLQVVGAEPRIIVMSRQRTHTMQIRSVCIHDMDFVVSISKSEKGNLVSLGERGRWIK
jgi:hypothetical protein